jgi:hypothetical protein
MDGWSLSDDTVGGIQFLMDLNAMGRGRIFGVTKDNKPPVTSNEDWMELLIQGRFNTSVLYYILRLNPALCNCKMRC